MAERLRQTIAERRFHFEDLTITVTCSFGVAQLDETMNSPEDLFMAADRALYQSKEAGRNRLTVYAR
jgi:diguanylate cyclase (GGDEF)-like protein